MKSIFLRACIGLMVLIMLTISAYAGPILDFGIEAPTAGSIDYAIVGGTLVGSGIEIDTVVGLDTLLNPDVVLSISGGLLNFATGNLTGTTANIWSFGGGPLTTITITGGIPALGIADGSTLMTGRFGSASVIGIGSQFKISGGAFMDTKNETLLDYYGLPDFLPNGDPFPYIGNFNISFMASGTPPATFESDIVLSGDVTNEPVPEPGTLILLGVGLVGLAGYGKFVISRRKK